MYAGSSLFKNVLRNSRNISLVRARPLKNFGHKRQPVPLVTTLWHGFLTFSFIGMLLKWDKIKSFIFGDVELGMLEDETITTRIET